MFSRVHPFQSEYNVQIIAVLAFIFFASWGRNIFILQEIEINLTVTFFEWFISFSKITH